ncbi:MAG: isochorismatase family protein [Myxococcaceae bacterium]
MTATALDPKTALVVIDLQKGLAGRQMLHPFAGVVANTARLANAFRRARLPVVWVTVAFSPDGGDRLQGRTDGPPLQIPATPEFSELVPELGAQPEDLRVTKRQPSAFHGTELELQLRRRGITGIVLTGVSASIGVDGTARAAQERGFNITFALDAITDPDQQSWDFVTRKMYPRLGQSDTTDAVLALLPK